MKKLLFINGHLNAGGVEKSLIDILTHLDYTKYEVDLLLFEGLGDYAEQLPTQVHVKLCDLKNTYGAVLPSLLRCIKENDWFCFRMRLIFLLVKLFGVEKLSLSQNLLTGGKHYDCAIGFRSGFCTQIASFAVNADRRITWWHHGKVNVDQSYLTDVRNCDQIVVVSDSCQKMLSEVFPSLSSKMVVIPNMLDVTEIREKSKAFFPDMDNEDIQIVSVGRLAEEKHFENAVYAASFLKHEGIAFQWHLVGDGPARTELEDQVKSLGLADCFFFKGNQTNPYPYLKSADLFAHPSYVESQGIVVMEAMALGIPCVVTKSLGPCEFIQDNENGILTEQSPEDFAEKVMQIFSNQQLYQKIKNNTACPNQFLPEQIMLKIDELLSA